MNQKTIWIGLGSFGGVCLVFTVFGIGVMVRREAVELALFNNARQVSSAAQQWCSENSTNQVTADKLFGPGAFITSLTPGVTLRGGDGLTAFTHAPQPAYAGIVLSTVPTTTTAASQTMFLSHPQYDTADSASAIIAERAGYPAGSQGLLFSVDSGEVLDAKGRAFPGGAVQMTPSIWYRTWQRIERLFSR